MIYIYIRDLKSDEYACQISYTVDEELNGNRVLESVIEYNKPNSLFIEEIERMWVLVDDDNTEHKIVYVKRQGEGDLMRVSIKAIPLFFDHFSSDRVYEEHNGSMTASNALDVVFDGSDFNYVLSGSFTAKELSGFGGGDTRLDMFKYWLDRYGGEFGEIVGNTVYIDNLVGNDLSVMYRHRLNASNIIQEVDATALHTFARGYGDYGDGEGSEDWQDAELIREYTSPFSDMLGIRHAPPIKNGNITKTATMDSNLKSLVDESIKISVSADIHDLTKQGYPIAQAENGDRVFLIDERIGLNEEVRVVNKNITKDWRGRILDINLVFGSQSITKRHRSSLNNAVQTVKDIMDGNAKLPINVLDNAVIAATNALKGAQTQLEFSANGILAIDKNDPNLVTLFNSAGLGVSEDGGDTFENAITGLGINASVVTTGTMLSDRIRGGILRSQNDNLHFNMNTGKFTMQNSNFDLGGGADIHFLSSGNKLYYQRESNNVLRSAGVGFGTSINDEYAYTSLGVSNASRPHANDSSEFSGFIANSNDREEEDSVGNSVVGNRFHVRDKAVSFSQGYLFRTNTNEPYFSPINTGVHSYRLGTPNNKWSEIHGTLVGQSTYDSKTRIEDIDGKKALDYFNKMIVKSFYYKDEDQSNEFNRKVSPIIEQLDPVLSNLYKANPDSLDISSNLFLLARAFKHFSDDIENRISLLEEAE